MNFDMTFALNWEDVRGARHFFKATRLPAPVRLVQKTLLALIFLSFGLLLLGAFRHWPQQYLKVPLGFVAVLLVLVWLRGMWVSMIRSGWINAGPQTKVSVYDEAMTVYARGKASKIAWASLESIAINDNAIYLVQRNGPGCVLPRRAFPPAISPEAFVNAVRPKTYAPSMLETTIAVATIPTMKAADPLSPEEAKRLESRGVLWIAIGVVGGLTVAGVVMMAVSNDHSELGLIPMVIGFAIHVWGCCLIAKARGFRAVHGLIALFVPILGVLFLATRARPEPGERIDRNTWIGFLSAPFAKQSDLSSLN